MDPGCLQRRPAEVGRQSSGAGPGGGHQLGGSRAAGREVCEAGEPFHA